MDRVLFANQLRGIAVFFVLIAHWGGVYWFDREVLTTYTFAPVESMATPAYIPWLAPPTLNYGTLGVAIFFLISGFVIPFSIRNTQSLSFLRARALRIYPTYLAASACMLAVAWASSRYWGTHFFMDPSRLISNLLLINNDIAQPTIDLVNWTLSVEIKFYIVAALMAGALRSANVNALIMLSVFIVAFCEWYPHDLDRIPLFGGHKLSVDNLRWQLMLIIYMFIGTCFYFLHSKMISVKEATTFIIILFGLFYICLPHTSFMNKPTVYNFIYGLIIFLGCFLLRSKFRPSRILDFMARISYPVYATHSIIGYSTLRFLSSNGIPYLISLIIAFSLIVALSYALHLWIETPSITFAKRYTRKITSPVPAL